jgi:integrase
MRLGEALALTWEDLDPEASTISITKTGTHVNAGAYVSDTPKAKKPNRTVLMDIETMSIFLHLPHRGPYVFFQLKGKFYYPSQPIRQLHKVVDGTDLKYISPHGFRHTHCSLLFSAGVSIP